MKLTRKGYYFFMCGMSGLSFILLVNENSNFSYLITILLMTKFLFICLFNEFKNDLTLTGRRR